MHDTAEMRGTAEMYNTAEMLGTAEIHATVKHRNDKSQAIEHYSGCPNEIVARRANQVI